MPLYPRPGIYKVLFINELWDEITPAETVLISVGKWGLPAKDRITQGKMGKEDYKHKNVI